MEMAISSALQAKSAGDYAVGAVLLKNERIVCVTGNRTKRDNVVTAHAEILAIEKASQKLNYRHLTDCVIFTTHEPCPMCAGAIAMAQIPVVVVGARLSDMQDYATEFGNVFWKWRTIDVPASYIFDRSSPSPRLVVDFMRQECTDLFHS